MWPFKRKQPVVQPPPPAEEKRLEPIREAVDKRIIKAWVDGDGRLHFELEGGLTLHYGEARITYATTDQFTFNHSIYR